MQRRVQILAVVVGMTALGFAVIREHPIAAYVTFGCALIVAILVLFHGDDADSPARIRKRLRTLSKIAKSSTNAQKFHQQNWPEVMGLRHLLENRFGVMQFTFNLYEPRNQADLEYLSKLLEDTAMQL